MSEPAVAEVRALLRGARAGGGAIGDPDRVQRARQRDHDVERRLPWSELVGPELSTTRVAQLRCESGLWTLYCSDSNDRWWLYDEADPAPDVRPLLAAIDDVTGFFWG